MFGYNGGMASSHLPSSPQHQDIIPPSQRRPKKNQLVLASIIIGAVGWLLAIIPYVGIVLGVVGLVLAFIARKKAPQANVWIVGVVIGAVALLAGLLFTSVVSLILNLPFS